MRKPKLPQMKVTGFANLRDKLERLSVCKHEMEGGTCPVVRIEDLVDYLLSIQEKSEEAVMILSKSSMYLGLLKKAEFEKKMKTYETDLRLYKQKKKESLQRQLAELEAE